MGKWNHGGRRNSFIFIFLQSISWVDHKSKISALKHDMRFLDIANLECVTLQTRNLQTRILICYYFLIFHGRVIQILQVGRK